MYLLCGNQWYCWVRLYVDTAEFYMTPLSKNSFFVMTSNSSPLPSPFPLPPPPSPLPPPPPDSDTVTKSSWRRVGGDLNSATDYIIYYGQLPLVLQLQHLCIVQLLYIHTCVGAGEGVQDRERERVEII